MSEDIKQKPDQLQELVDAGFLLYVARIEIERTRRGTYYPNNDDTCIGDVFAYGQ